MNLKYYLEKLKDLILKKDIVNEEDMNTYKSLIDKILDKATTDFFPKVGRWYNNCYKKSKDGEMRNLPCHLRDDEWLAMMLREEQKLNFLSVSRIYEYIQTSKYFEEKRHEYELEIVKWQINWMKTDGEGWICKNEYGDDCGILMPTCDLWFRKGIVDTLSAIGMALDAIEEGIEKYADLWRDNYMGKAFNNKFELVFIPYIAFHDNVELNTVSSIPSASEEHKEKWLKMRRYEYYQNHKDSVDKYGVVSDDMLMTKKEVEKLKKELEIMNEQRLQVLEQNKGIQKIIAK